MKSELNVRRVQTDEVEPLREVSVSTFINTYEHHNTLENMSSYISRSFDRARLLAELNSEDTHYYFVEREADILGYLRLNFGAAQTNQSIPDACEIERIYVVSKYKGQKIGKLLFEKAVTRTRNAGLKWVWLGVWDQNTNAIGFYKNMGFEVFGSHDFKLGTEEQTDLLMRFPTRSG